MPTRKEFRHFYTGKEWQATRQRILERAGYKCEQCGKPDREVVETITGRGLSIYGAGGRPEMYWRSVSCSWRTWLGIRAIALTGFPRKKIRTIRVVLSVCHVNHVSGDDRDGNLRAWCQWCHLHFDQGKHKETRAIRKDAKRPLMQAS
jgi:hypothetical protein